MSRAHTLHFRTCSLTHTLVPLSRFKTLRPLAFTHLLAHSLSEDFTFTHDDSLIHARRLLKTTHEGYSRRLLTRLLTKTTHEDYSRRLLTKTTHDEEYSRRRLLTTKTTHEDSRRSTKTHDDSLTHSLTHSRRLTRTRSLPHSLTKFHSSFNLRLLLCLFLFKFSCNFFARYSLCLLSLSSSASSLPPVLSGSLRVREARAAVCCWFE